jgi:hypothetical protein
VSTWLIGWTAGWYSFEPILVAASLAPLVATVLVMTLVRTPRADGHGSGRSRGETDCNRGAVATSETYWFEVA